MMLKNLHISSLLALCFIMFTPSLSQGQDVCGVSHDRWSLEDASDILDFAEAAIVGIPDCYGDNRQDCVEVRDAMWTAKDHITQVLAISRGLNCKC